MSIKMMTAVWGDEEIQEQGELLLMLALADFSDDDGDSWPSIETLAAKSRHCERAVQYAIKKLEEKGKLTIERGGGQGKSNRYHITKGAMVAPFTGQRVQLTTAKGAIDDSKGCNPLHPIRQDPSMIQRERVCTPLPPAPPRLEEVLGRASQIGCLPTEAESFWNHFEASGWVDKNGNAVVNWRAKLATWSANARAKPLEAAHKAAEVAPKTKQGGFWQQTKELELIDAELRAISARSSHTACEVIMSDSDMEKAQRLRARKNELKQELGLS